MGGIEKKKVWAGMIVVPPILLLILFGPPPVLPLMVLLATFFGLREFYKLALPRSNRIEQVTGIALGILLSLLVSFGDGRWIPPFFAMLLLVLSVLFMVTSQDLSRAISNIGMSFFGIFYIGFLLSHVSLIRNLPDGKQWALFLIVAIWMGDISAFVSGSFLGRHKLYPKISPKKTWEGLLGAVLGAVLVALFFAWTSLLRLGTGQCILLGFSLGILGQVGDFIESMIKRSAQVKDSGALIPGHGGMLDRLDSFLFSAPFLHYALLYLLREAP